MDHLFVDCIESKNFYFEIRNWLEEFDIDLPVCNKANIILGIDDELANFIILLYKFTLYKQREKQKAYLSISFFKNTVRQYRTIEYKAALNKNKINCHTKKWKKLINFV